VSLSGLTTLSDDAADSLEANPVIFFPQMTTGDLSGIYAQQLKDNKQWTVSRARKLARRDDFWFILSVQTELLPEVAEVLPSKDGSLSLNGLRTMSPELAKALTTRDCGLVLCGLMSLTPEVAGMLALNARWLDLSGLTTLSPEVAEALAKQQGGVSLNGLTELSVETAQALAKHQGSLTLGGLKSPSPDVARALAKHRGGFLSLCCNSELSDEAAEELRSHPQISLPEKFR
jgi:hypothetical protein